MIRYANQTQTNSDSSDRITSQREFLVVGSDMATLPQTSSDCFGAGCYSHLFTCTIRDDCPRRIHFWLVHTFNCTANTDELQLGNLMDVQEPHVTNRKY
ncbi:hypothetical protein J6590_028382 [Homalodisca vitripennis]|nr:hypothetical protein J6590_028382 [Homalodisca vitripennis]